MKIYYCNDCGEIVEEFEILIGVTYAVDNYRNDSCGECGSDNLIEIEESDICPVCNRYHSEDDIRRDLRFMGALADDVGIYEWIDTNEAKTAV